MMRGVRIACLVSLIFFAGSQKPDHGSTLNILFVGNSLTYVNDLPSLVSQIARLDGVDVTFKVVAYPDYSLDDHIDRGDMYQLLANEKFDFLK